MSAGKASYAMALSPPSAYSNTTPAIVPPVASTTTEYCVPSASPSTVRGSIFTLSPVTSGSDWLFTRPPSLKRYQRSVAMVAPADWRTIGVVQPAGPPSARVTFGR